MIDVRTVNGECATAIALGGTVEAPSCQRSKKSKAGTKAMHKL